MEFNKVLCQSFELITCRLKRNVGALTSDRAAVFECSTSGSSSSLTGRPGRLKFYSIHFFKKLTQLRTFELQFFENCVEDSFIFMSKRFEFLKLLLMAQ
jgi:hypothetical protein